ncbi:hypothetical protein IW262DRAFT_1459473 [Armillaria fumosa]|nr:hypothetical protein IW262DRAFT_1459473 [Armillaria fumosa]
MSLQSSSGLPSVSETLGALYVGAIIAAVLYGITNVQGVVYYRRYPNDWWVYRYSVGLLWVLDTIQVALSTYAIYFFLIHFFGDLNGALEYKSWFMKGQLALNVFLAVYIQGLYALRLCQLGRHFHKSLTYFVPLAVVASLGTAIYVEYDTYISPNMASTSNFKTPICIFFSTIVITDLIIAIPMFYYLHKSRAIIRVPSLNSRSKYHSTNQAIDDEVNALPILLQITPHSSASGIGETNISIPVPDISSVNNKLGPSQADLDPRV